MQVITREELRRWLDRLAAENDLFAPVLEEKLPVYRHVKAASEVTLDYGGRANTLNSPKEYFFPATETILEVRHNGDGYDVVTPGLERDRVIFGVRPCDAAALSCLDSLFLQEPADQLYAEKRARAVLIGVACLKPAPECFCTSVEGRPDGTENLDVLLTPVGEDYAVQALSDRGRSLLGGVAVQERAGETPVCELPESRFPVASPDEWVGHFNDEYWSRLGERCLGCKVCTFVCPTCYCFDVRDYAANGVVRRLRCWDACQAKDFYTEASGHNPRPAQWMRLRNRFYHKFHYFPSRFGRVKCVGCGRCVAQCPVNVDITEVLEDVAKPTQPASSVRE